MRRFFCFGNFICYFISGASLISSDIDSVVLSSILSIDASILCSTEFEALEPKFEASSFKESKTAADVDGNQLSISFENTIPPKIIIPAIMPNLMNIMLIQKNEF